MSWKRFGRSAGCRRSAANLNAPGGWGVGYAGLVVLALVILGSPGVSHGREAVGKAGGAAPHLAIGTKASAEARGERDPERDSVETFKDLTKLLISLATGTLVLAPTLFALLKSMRVVAWRLLYASAFVLTLSVLAGILTLSTLAGSQHANDYNIDHFLTRLFALPQWIGFVVGVAFFMVFVFKNLRRRTLITERLGEVLDVLVRKGLLTADEKGELLRRLEGD